MRIYLFYIFWLFVGFSSSYDVYLSLKYKNSLSILEENPIGRYLIELGDGDVSLLVGCKMAGTITALGILSLYYNLKPVNAFIVVIALTVFQIMLLLYLLGA